MSNPLEMFKMVLVTIVTHDNTIVAGRVSRETSEIVAAEGPSAHRASDMILAVGEAFGHDELFGLLDDLMDDIVATVPYESDGTIDATRLAEAVSIRPAQATAFYRVLDRLVSQGRIRRTPDDTYYVPEED